MSGSNVIGLNDSVNRAVLSALATADTLVRIDGEGKKILTYTCGTLLVNNVCDVLLAEELEGSKHGVGSSLTETAERVLLDVVAEVLELIDILESALTVGDLLKDLEKTSCTYTAGSALTAGLINSELKEELSHINHTGVLIHYDKTARTHHTADGGEVIVVNLGVDEACRDTSAGGTAGLSCLELLTVGNTAADVINDLTEGSTHGDLNETGVLDLTAECEYLSTLGLLGTHRGEPLNAVEDDLRNICEGLNVVLDCGRCIETLYCRIGRTGSGLAAVTLDRGHKSGLLTTDERACAESDLKIEIKAGIKYVLTEKTVLISSIDSLLKTLNCDGILGTNVNVTLGSTDSITADGHSLDDGVGVTLKDGTVHECSGVALVGITYNVLLRSLVGGTESPLTAGGESTASSTAETGVGNYLDNVLGSHFGENLAECCITVHSYVLVDVIGIDNAAVTEYYTLLGLVECCVVKRNLSLGNYLLSAGVCINEMLNDTTLEKMLLNDLLNILGSDTAIEGTLGVNDNDRAECTETEATGLYYLYLFGEAVSLELLVEGSLDSLATGGGTTCTATNQYV